MKKLLLSKTLCFALMTVNLSSWSQATEPPVQQWNELLLEAIRNDLARPNVTLETCTISALGNMRFSC